MDDILSRWRDEGRIGPAALAAVIVPTWSRTLEEFRAPFEEQDDAFAGLRLERAELFSLDNPYRDDDPQVFAENYVRSVEAWGGPLFARALGIAGAGESAELLQDLHDGLVSRVAGDPQRYRRDYHQALIVCRKEPD
jgi:hypothetical protein